MFVTLCPENKASSINHISFHTDWFILPDLSYQSDKSHSLVLLSWYPNHLFFLTTTDLAILNVQSIIQRHQQHFINHGFSISTYQSNQGKIANHGISSMFLKNENILAQSIIKNLFHIKKLICFNFWGGIRVSNISSNQTSQN